MSLKVPFQGVERPVVWLRLTLLSAMFLGLIASAPLWSNTHSFPLLPIISSFSILPRPWDTALFISMLLALVLALWFYGPAIGFFLSAGLWMFVQDQNRGQPWFYMYWVMLLLSLLSDSISLAACRVAISVAYIWSGIQKLNPRFFQVTPEWFVAPAAKWHFPAGLVQVLQGVVTATPFIELGIGLALWIPKLRKAAIITTVAVHLSALLFLGPLGYNYNWVVWPWNLAMIGLVWSLFGVRNASSEGSLPGGVSPSSEQARSEKRVERIKRTQAKTSRVAGSGETRTLLNGWLLKPTLRELSRSKFALVMVGSYSLLPILSYVGRWDSYFSFALYSENAAVANVFISKEFGERLPARLQPYVQKFPLAYDPQHQGPYTFGFQAWGYEELHVPPISELRNFQSVFRFLRSYSREPGDLRMIVGQRSGPVIFYEGNHQEFLTPK